MNCKLILGVSSRSLFDLNDSHDVFTREGVEAFAKYQIANEDKPLKPGPAFSLVKKLLALNSRQANLCDVILMSRNSHDTGLRVFNSIAHHGLDISRAAFCGGHSPWRLAKAFHCDLYLSTDAEDVRGALDSGIAAAQLLNPAVARDSDEICIAFDGDAVLFSDEAERVFAREGLAAFQASEKRSAKMPLKAGPFKSFLDVLHQIQQSFTGQDCPIKTALVTARSAPGHERVMRTLRSWNIRVDESVFLGGLEKTEFLNALNADIFFDDQKYNVESQFLNFYK